MQADEFVLSNYVINHHDSQRSRQEILDLELRTKYVAIEAGCMIDSHAMDELLMKRHVYSEEKTSCSQLFPDEVIHRVIKEFESVQEEAMKIIKDVKASEEAQQSTNVIQPAAAAATPLTRALSRVETKSNSTMVGFGQHLLAVMDRITGTHESSLQIHPILGMGGIGKTTLTQNVFHNQLIKEHFHFRLWATVSQPYNLKKILLSFLQDLKIVHENIATLHELGDKLYKTLYGRRYLIVMDDIWNDKVWDEIGRFFPKNDNGSRVLVTTRLLSVASRLGSCDPYKLEYLDEDESWNLLESKVFAQDGCPATLEDVGRRTAVSCQGLPLAIVVIAGHLAKSDMTIESWEDVAEALISILHSENDSQCLKILSLSYDNLPLYLKPCFLHMAFFEVGSEFNASRMIKYWVAEGLLKPIRDQCLEDSAAEYLTDLVERNLISVSKRGSNGKVKCFRIHDLLHDLCIRKSWEHKFLYNGIVENDHTLGMETNSNDVYTIPLSKFSLRVSEFDLSSFKWANKSVHQVADCNLWDVRLRYIQLSSSESTDISTSSEPLAITSMFQNLQTLEIAEMQGNEPIVLPPVIWEMPLLRHVLIKRVAFPDLATDETSVIGRESCVLMNLQTLCDVHCFKLSAEVVKRIPNLKKLKITYPKVSESTVEWSYYNLHNLAQLCKLESLSFSVCGQISPLDFSLPQSLRKLTLDGCKLPFKDMIMVGLLPNLEVLRLQNDAFCGRQWKPVEGEFCHLKALHLRNMSFQRWEADSSHFPKLERLILYNVWRLEEIPLSIGEIPTLQFISAEFCRFSLELSIRQLIVEQRNMGNNGIEVELPRVFFWVSDNSSNIMQYVCNFLFNFLHYNNHPPHETSVMIQKFEDNLRELQSFLSYTTKEGTDERLKELVKHIRDVMYEAVDVTYTALLQADKSKSLSFSFRRAINVVKEVEYVTLKAQHLRLCVGDVWDEEEFGSSYKDFTDLIDWNTDDEAYNFRLLQLINQHMNKLDPDWLAENPELEKYLEPVGDKSRAQVIFRDFTVLSAVDRISIEDELNQDQISTVHVGCTCDYCEIEPIVGAVYVCKDCKNFGLCEECFSSGLVSEHPGLCNNRTHTAEHEFEIVGSGIHATRLMLLHYMGLYKSI